MLPSSKIWRRIIATSLCAFSNSSNSKTAASAISKYSLRSSKKSHTVGPTTNGLRQLTTLFESNISWCGTNQTRNSVAIVELRHVDVDPKSIMLKSCRTKWVATHTIHVTRRCTRMRPKLCITRSSRSGKQTASARA